MNRPIADDELLSILLDQKLCNDESIKAGQRYQQKSDILCTPVPRLMGSVQYKHLCADAKHVWAALERVATLYGKEARITEYFSHLSLLSELMHMPSSCEPLISLARFDIVETEDGRFFVVEPGTASPGATVLTGLFHDIASQTQTFQRATMNRSVMSSAINDKHAVIRFLSGIRTRISKTSGVLAVANSVIDPFTAELPDIVRAAREIGVDAIQCCLNEIEYRHGKAFAQGRQIDMVYGFPSIRLNGPLANLAYAREDIAGYLDGWRNHAFMVVNPSAPMFVTEDKSVLALLRDAKFSELFTIDEHAAFERIIPATFRLVPGPVVCEGERVDLERLLLSRQHDFLLKPQMEDCGRDIVFGCELSSQAWGAAIREHMNGLYIAQQAIESKITNLPSPRHTEPTMLACRATLGLFFFDGEPVGIVNRLSPDRITNIAKGGFMQSVEVVDVTPP